jgi:hypothetical protein
MNADLSAGQATPRPRRLALYLPFALLLLVALGWSAFWFYGRSRVNGEIDAFLARQASLGREWSCPNRSIGGFPFRIEGRCTDPSYRERRADGEVAGSLKGLTVVATTAGAFDLAHVITEFEGPLTVKAPGLPDTVTTWRTARSSIRGGVSRLERASLEVENPTVAIAGAGAQWSAEKLTAHLREGVDPAQPGAYDLAIRLDRAAAPELDALLGSADPFNLELDSRVLKAGAIDRRDWRQTIENWRANGGTLRIEQLKLSKGAPRVEAKGDLRLDEQRRVEGQLDASFVNAGALLQQFGLGGGGGGGLLGALLGGGRRPANAEAPRRETTMRLPLTLEGGRVAVGPIRIPGLLLRPLY